MRAGFASLIGQNRLVCQKIYAPNQQSKLKLTDYTERFTQNEKT